MTSSSSSDDEDNLALLRESVDPMFIKTFAQKTEGSCLIILVYSVGIDKNFKF